MKLTVESGSTGKQGLMVLAMGMVLMALVMPCPAQRLVLFVGGDSGNPITYYSATTGAAMGQLAAGRGITQDTNDYFYAALSDNTIRKYSPSLQDLGTFASESLSVPTFLHFASNGDLFVSSSSNKRILRYNSSGVLIQTIYLNEGVDGPRGITTNPNNGHMLVATSGHRVYEYSFSGGNPVLEGEFVSAGSGGLENPGEIRYGPNGDLFVASSSQAVIQEYDGVTGAYVGQFSTFNYAICRNPLGVAWHPGTGNLFMTSTAPGYQRVIECNGTTGAIVFGRIPAKRASGQ